MCAPCRSAAAADTRRPRLFAANSPRRRRASHDKRRNVGDTAARPPRLAARHTSARLRSGESKFESHNPPAKSATAGKQIANASLRFIRGWRRNIRPRFFLADKSLLRKNKTRNNRPPSDATTRRKRGSRKTTGRRWSAFSPLRARRIAGKSRKYRRRFLASRAAKSNTPPSPRKSPSARKERNRSPEKATTRPKRPKRQPKTA